jgi:hypothetical protein
MPEEMPAEPNTVFQLCFKFVLVATRLCSDNWILEPFKVSEKSAQASNAGALVSICVGDGVGGVGRGVGDGVGGVGRDVGDGVGGVGDGVEGVGQSSLAESPLSPMETANRYVPAVKLWETPSLTPFFLKLTVFASMFRVTVITSPATYFGPYGL